MGFTLEKVVPWGRSYDEYVRMFDLAEDHLGSLILGCGDGPAGFNAELTRRGGRVVSCDPVYQFNIDDIQERVTETYPAVLNQLAKNQENYVWDTIASIEELGRVRMSAMENFLSDFTAGKGQGRYIAAELPDLPFKEGAFRLALSSHFLFLYSSILSAEFHIQALAEMLRVANEVRVFPLLALDGTPSPHVRKVKDHFSARGFVVGSRNVNYEFQRGGNALLIVKRSTGPPCGSR